MTPSTQTPQPPQPRPLPRSLYPNQITYKPTDFKRLNESKDALWYSQPRFVQHIDNTAITALKSYYQSQIKESDKILDICSSWTSHFPSTFHPKSIIGYGMNDIEMAANPHLTRHIVRDLNEDPSLREITDGDVDVVICNVSVDYLIRPVKVFGEIGRILKGGGCAHMVFSDRCFPEKVIGRWLGMSDQERRRWVGGYFWAAGGGGVFEGVEEVVLKDGVKGFEGEDPLFVVRGVRVKREE